MSVSHPSSPYLLPILNPKIFVIAKLFLWSCSIASAKSTANLNPNILNLFLSDYLVVEGFRVDVILAEIGNGISYIKTLSYVEKLYDIR